ncbi:porin [Confluentibacter citreus]|uniref:porin n=1 Tax=Confluentibacter citreus TaxID=2007307 RepID=UPI000C287DBA|nr:porin [Confluentibacter citreus]
MKKLLVVITIVHCCSLISFAQNNLVSNDTIDKEWYQEINLRGYAQLRYNGLIQTNPDLTCEQCDKSWGGDSDFFFRRIRLVFYGQIHPRVYFYIQPDFASASGSNQHFGQIRDAYVDVGLDSKNEFRFRVGQSKVPFGFENMQSSQNRLTLDRNDGLNSAVRNERDLGIFFYWAPKKIRERFSMLVKDGYKGSGDYGVLGLGVYNGQTANLEELNNKKHIVARLAYPFEIGTQIFEAGIQAYTGDYTIDSKQISEGVQHREDNTYIDQRFAVSAILYPKPFGIQAEYNFGKGPEFNKVSNSIEVQNLHGGYLTLNAMLPINKQLIYPFAKVQYYNGGKKHELDARSYEVKELELGVEWQPYKSIELVAMYTFSDRRYEDFINPDNHQVGSLLRLQFQVNF